MLLIYNDETRWDSLGEAEMGEVMKRYGDFTAELRASSAMIAGDRLQPTANATTVRVRDGEQLVTDGPFAETKEQLGGYYLIEVETLDEALEWARKIPGARLGSIEVRPVLPVGAPAEAAS